MKQQIIINAATSTFKNLPQRSTSWQRWGGFLLLMQSPSQNGFSKWLHSDFHTRNGMRRRRRRGGGEDNMKWRHVSSLDLQAIQNNNHHICFLFHWETFMEFLYKALPSTRLLRNTWIDLGVRRLSAYYILGCNMPLIYTELNIESNRK